MKDKAVLVINAGSSSIKFAIFSVSQEIKKIYSGIVDKVGIEPELTIYNGHQTTVLTEKFALASYEEIVADFIKAINKFLQKFVLIAVGHRVVHGGVDYLTPVIVNDQIIADLTKIIPLAPLHQPYNLKLITAIKNIYPDLPQVACFDTGFHASQNKLIRSFAIPRELSSEGVMKYGFHGLSYEYIASILPKYFSPDIVDKKIIVAHLGNGSSCCGLDKGKSVATSMGFTALEGLMMGTRCGNIDPGVLLYLLDQKKLSIQELTKLLYSKSGLLGVSDISSDIRELQDSLDPKAQDAIDLYCYKAAREMIALSIVSAGVDVIIFTAGIGENSALVRKKICDWLSWLGIVLDDNANQQNAKIISSANSKITVAIVPTNEELMIVSHTLRLVG